MNTATSKLAQVAGAKKKCRECNKTKATDLFSNTTKSADGLQPFCKECMSEKLKAGHAKRKKALKDAEKLLGITIRNGEGKKVVEVTRTVEKVQGDRRKMGPIAKLERLVYMAEGMAQLDERMIGFAAQLERVHLDIVKEYAL